MSNQLENQNREELDLEKANKLIFVRKFEDAYDLLSRLCVESSASRSNVLVQLRRIELAAKLKRLNELEAEYAVTERELKGTPEARIIKLLVGLHTESISLQEAIAGFQSLVKENGSNHIAYYAIAYCLELDGNTERAVYNYEKSIAINPDWYPSYFGLSQLYYQRGDTPRGDDFFLLFEKYAPYNIYGNFETHRALSNEFLEAGKLDDAEVAITTLSTWWIENRGRCPMEIQIFEHLAVGRIASLSGDVRKAQARNEAAIQNAKIVMADKTTMDGVSYFLARCFEDYGNIETALQFYKNALSTTTLNPNLVQKIGSHFLVNGKLDLAFDLFQDAYEKNPDNAEIRFCLLITKLRKAGVQVEDYLIGKERLKNLLNMDAEKVEALSLMHQLIARFPDDPDIHGHLADLYLRLGHVSKAKKHFSQMFHQDQHSQSAMIRYATFLVQYDEDPKAAGPLLEQLQLLKNLKSEIRVQYQWLWAKHCERSGDTEASQQWLKHCLQADPWNVSYLMQAIQNTQTLAALPEDLRSIDTVFQNINSTDEKTLNWLEYDQKTRRLNDARQTEIVYLRCKLRFLYSHMEPTIILQLVAAACSGDTAFATADFLRLLNTNYDHPVIYWALGKLHKELWQLEVAMMWFEQCLRQDIMDNSVRATCYAELADCLVWTARDLSKAEEYGKLSLDLGIHDKLNTQLVLAHALLKQGKIRDAETKLTEIGPSDEFDAVFLAGLLAYRNNNPRKAKEIWKPLLIVTAETTRTHHIKQEIMRYYYEQSPYLSGNQRLQHH